MSTARSARRTVLLLASAGAAAAGLGGADLAAQPAPQADSPHREIAARIAREFVIPRTRALQGAAQAQDEAWARFCAAPRREGLGALEAAFHAVADAWSGIEAVRLGPVAENLRHERMAHWPERKNAVGKALAGLLAGTDALTPERLRRASIAGQGLSALERLLFGEAAGGAAKARAALLEGSAAAQRRCSLGLAIAAGLARTTGEMAAGWTEPDGPLARLERAAPDEAREAVTRLATDHLAMLQATVEAKLTAVLGKDLDEARPLLAENWRSARSLRAVKLNIDAAEAFSRAALAGDAEALGSVLAGLDTARSVAGGLAVEKAALGELAADPKRRRDLFLLRDALASAREVSGPVLAEALRVTIGFNSQDGD